MLTAVLYNCHFVSSKKWNDICYKDNNIFNFNIMTKENIFKIMVDQKPFDVVNQFITGLEIKKLVGTPANYGVWLKVNGPNPDKEIADDEQVDLSQPGREHFFTGAKSTTEG